MDNGKMINTQGISLIICCYNSSRRLPVTLAHIARQQCRIPWELIIVNNNSSDNTEAVAKAEWNKYTLHVPFSIVQEPQSGLSFARKKGIDTAKYNLLLFCDDDNHLEQHYLQNAFDIMNAHENVAVLGGISAAKTEITPAKWFSRFQNSYAIGKQMPASGIANRRRYIAGAGMVLRKNVFYHLTRMGFTNILPDRQGKALSSGGDSELCLMILFLGYDLYYDERLQFTHFIPRERLSWSYCVKMLAGAHGIPQVYFSFYKILYRKAVNKETIHFTSAYKITLQNFLRSFARNFLGEIYCAQQRAAYCIYPAICSR